MTAQRREDIDVRLPSPEPEDKELTLAFQRGEKGAYQAIYDRYHQRVLNVCRRMLGKPEDAEEAAQEAFLRVYQALYRFNGRYQLGPWVTRIATNVCLDHLRSRARKPCEPTTDELLELEIDTSDEDPEAIHIKRFEGRRVRRVLAGLPPMHRAAIVLRDFEGLSYEEVAIALDITEAQVKALIHRARQNFKRSWNPLDVAQILLPWRLMQKLKRPDVVAGENVVHAARTSGSLAESATSLTQAASSCSVALHHCGQFMGERVTALAATVIVGSAAIGGVAVGQPTAVRAERSVGDASARDLTDGGVNKPLPARGHTRAKIQPSNASKPATAAPPEPSTDPGSSSRGDVPAPSPTPTPAGSPAPAATPEPAASPTPNSGNQTKAPTPQKTPAQSAPTQVSLGFARGESIPSGEPESNDALVDCAATEMRQVLRAPMWDGDRPLPAELSLRFNAQSASIDLALDNDGRQHSYNGGSSSVRIVKSGDKMDVTFSGSYSWNGGSRPDSGSLPDYGRFDASVSLDCAAGRVVTESLTFTT